MAWDNTQSISSTESENQPQSNVIMPSVMIGIPYKEKFSAAFFKGLYTVKLPPLYDMAFDGGSRPLDLSRNIIVAQAMQKKFEYLLMLDSDIVLHDDLTINKLLHKRESVVAAMYNSRSAPQIIVGTETGGKPITLDDPRIAKGELIDMDAVGMGATLIHMAVFHKIGQTRRWRCLTNHRNEGFESGVFSVNYEQAVQNEFTCPHCKKLLIATFFHYTHGKFDGDESDEDGFPIAVCSEDYFFCQLAKRAGYSIKLATDIDVWHETSDWLATKNGLVTMQQHGGQL